MLKHFVLFIAALTGLSGCAHLSPSESIVRDMLIAGAIGAAIGQQQPKDPQLCSAMYGGLAASSAAMVGLIVHDPEQVSRRVELENQMLRRELKEVREPKEEARMPAVGWLPPEVRKLIRPGEWRVLEIDQWVEDGENRLVHQDKVVELTPPSLVPRGK